MSGEEGHPKSVVKEIDSCVINCVFVKPIRDHIPNRNEMDTPIVIQTAFEANIDF